MGPIPPVAGRADYDPPRPDAEECSPSSGTLVPREVGGVTFSRDAHRGEARPAPRLQRGSWPIGCLPVCARVTGVEPAPAGLPAALPRPSQGAPADRAGSLLGHLRRITELRGPPTAGPAVPLPGATRGRSCPGDARLEVVLDAVQDQSGLQVSRVDLAAERSDVR